MGINRTKVLVVDDCAEFSRAAAMSMRHWGYLVDVAHNAIGALDLVRGSPPDAVLLELRLPDADGLEVLRDLRCVGYSGAILMVSAHADDFHRVAAFRLGADDCMAKPLSFFELQERIRVRLYSRRGTAVDDLLVSGPVIVDPSRRSVMVGESLIRLTSKEFDLLIALIRNAGRVMSRGDLLSHVWKHPPGLKTRTVDVHVSNLRSKLRAFGLAPFIQCVTRNGFVWNGPDTQSDHRSSSSAMHGRPAEMNPPSARGPWSGTNANSPPISNRLAGRKRRLRGDPRDLRQ